MHTPKIRTFAPQEWRTYRDLWLQALADSPDAFGRTLAQEQTLSDDEWSGRLSSSADSDWDLALMAEVDDKPIGLARGRIDRANPQVANLYHMWVAPSHRRLGAGQKMLGSVIAWARAKNACYLDLGVTLGDTPAMRLYTRAGFEPVGEPEPIRQGFGQLMRLKL